MGERKVKRQKEEWIKKEERYAPTHLPAHIICHKGGEKHWVQKVMQTEVRSINKTEKEIKKQSLTYASTYIQTLASAAKTVSMNSMKWGWESKNKDKEQDRELWSKRKGDCSRERKGLEDGPK